MKITRKCRHGGDEEDDVYYMLQVNKGAQKIITAFPDQLSLVFIWSLMTIVFVIFTYLVLRFEFPPPQPSSSAALHTSRGERCPTDSRNPLVARQDIGPNDIHYVLVDDDRIPRLFACSLESAVKSMVSDGFDRVNVFVVGGIKRVEGLNITLPLRQLENVSLSSTLDNLVATYGHGRLNVTYLSLEEYLSGSPFKGVDLSSRPGLAEFAVQLVILWQFGGTVLDGGMTAAREYVYRATTKAVEYGDRIISSPVACHVFVYEAMLSAKRFALGGERFMAGTVQTILDGTATVVRDGALPLPDWVVCPNYRIMMNGHLCCYVAGVTPDFLGDRCPIVIDEPSLSPKFQETARVTSPRFRKPVSRLATTTVNASASADDQNRNTTNDERVSTAI